MLLGSFLAPWSCLDTLPTGPAALSVNRQRAFPGLCWHWQWGCYTDTSKLEPFLPISNNRVEGGLAFAKYRGKCAFFSTCPKRFQWSAKFKLWQLLSSSLSSGFFSSHVAFEIGWVCITTSALWEAVIMTGILYFQTTIQVITNSYVIACH